MEKKKKKKRREKYLPVLDFLASWHHFLFVVSSELGCVSCFFAPSTFVVSSVAELPQLITKKKSMRKRTIKKKKRLYSFILGLENLLISLVSFSSFKNFFPYKNNLTFLPILLAKHS